MKMKATNIPPVHTATKKTSTARGQHVRDQATSVDLAMDQEDGETVKIITPSHNAQIHYLHKQTMTYDTLVIKYNQATNTNSELTEAGTQSVADPGFPEGGA